MLDHDGHGRWQMHDLVRSYASTTAQTDLTEELRETALRRVLDFYVHTARNADRVLNRSRTPMHLDRPTAQAVTLSQVGWHAGDLGQLWLEWIAVPRGDALLDGA